MLSEIIGGFDQICSYIDIVYAKIRATTKIRTVVGYHVMLAKLLLLYGRAALFKFWGNYSNIMDV